LARDVDAEAALARQLEREIEFVEVIELLVIGFGQDPGDRFRVLLGQDFVAEFVEVTVVPLER